MQQPLNLHSVTFDHCNHIIHDKALLNLTIPILKANDAAMMHASKTMLTGLAKTYELLHMEFESRPDLNLEGSIQYFCRLISNFLIKLFNNMHLICLKRTRRCQISPTLKSFLSHLLEATAHYTIFGRPLV